LASIKEDSAEQVYTLKKWMGIHESPDGDTKLAIGEAAAMDNWRVTRDGNIAKRPGSRQWKDYGGPCMGVWSGFVGGHYMGLACANNKLWKFYEDGEWVDEEIGGMCTERRIGFIPYQENLYLLNGEEYLCFDGCYLDNVGAYVPVVVIGLTSEGEGTEYEQINKLTAKRRVWLSPDGTDVTWTMPEEVDTINYVKDRATLNDIEYTRSGNAITFSTAPTAGVDTIEVEYSSPTSYRSQVEAMRFGELYTGVGDARILIYGDGSNAIFYSDCDMDGNLRADYFPDLNVANIGANSPVNSIVRHCNECLVFKSDSCYTLNDTTTQLSSGLTRLGFTVKNVNRSHGNSYCGEIVLRENDPIAMYNHEIYRWHSNNTYTGAMSYDERQCERISDRVYSTCRKLDMKNAFVFDDDSESEVWFTDGDNILINNYACDAWYTYSGMHLNCLARVDEYLIGGDNVGIRLISNSYTNDDTEKITAYWESGFIPFDKTYKRKFSAMTWVAMKQLSNGYLHVRIKTDRDQIDSKKDLQSIRSSFLSWNFNSFSFSTLANAKIVKLKLKAKKFVYYKLIFISDQANKSCLVTDFDILVRETGNAK